jgi:chorismate mutase-like protein
MLDELRRRLDAIDDRIHDLIMERAAVVEQVTTAKQSNGQPSLRPGREAAILRRLVARHHGPFPRQSLVRLWRELLGGGVAIQGRFQIAVLDAQPGLWDLARDHFGTYLPLLPVADPGAVLAAISERSAQAGVLPMPARTDTAPWWPALAAHGGGVHIVARLPFADRGNGRGGDAVIVAAAQADATGTDRTLMAIKAAKSMKPQRLLAALEEIGAPIAHIATHEQSTAEAWHLIEFDGMVAADDPRLTAALHALGEPAPAARLLGSYARLLPRENDDNRS